MKCQKQVMVKNLSGLGGVKDVKLGDASPDARANRDFSKDGSSLKPASKTFDDYDERMERWGNGGW